MREDEALYAAASTQFGLIVQGSASALRRARSELAKSDLAIAELSVLGPSPSGEVWLVRRDALRGHLIREEQEGEC